MLDLCNIRNILMTDKPWINKSHNNALQGAQESFLFVTAQSCSAVCMYLDKVGGLVLVFQDNILTDQHKFTLSNMICIFFFHLLKGGRMR